tara:strand:- start:486 stop:794 length:309 start_codon:yes stop_codon:yes gene_type:complete
MPNYFASDLDVFFDTDTHGIDCVFTPSGGSATTIKGIFNNEYYAMGGGEVDVESSQPVFYSKASNLSSASHGDSMVINSVTYKIINIRPDETGMIEVVLEKQ